MTDKHQLESAANLHGSGRKFWPLTVAVLVALCVLVSLGVWQLQRLAWKENLISQIEARQRAAPISLADVIARRSSGDDVAFTKVRVRGQFLHHYERFFYAPDAKLGPGFDIYTPFVVTDPGGLIVVNRGFVPDALKAQGSRLQGQVAGEQEITGVIRLPGRKGFFTPDNDSQNNLWFWRDFTAMTKTSETVSAGQKIELFIDAEAPAPGGWPRGGVPEIAISNRHFGYALTWFGLAATLLGVYGVLAWGRRWK